MNKYTNSHIGIDLSQNDFSDFADLIPTLITVFDENHNVLYVNKTVVSDLGYESRDQIVGRSLVDLTGIDPLRLSRRVELIQQQGQADYDEFNIRCFAGNCIVVESRGILIKWQGLKAYMSVATNITKNKELYSLFTEVQQIVESKNAALVQKMFDLNLVMGEMESYKKNLELKVAANIQNSIMPLLDKLKAKQNSEEYIALLEDQLNEILSEFGQKISANLTPREREVIAFIKAGRTNKEIATILNLSSRTIDRHRQAIRDKLKLSKSGVSLSAWLQDNL